MNIRVKKKMFNLPVTEFPVSTKDAAGDTVEATPILYKGYITETLQTVTDQTGREVVSGVQIFMDGADIVKIDMASKISCLTHVKLGILKRACFRKPDGSPDVGVLYLP
jgi:hypothetical protein